MTFNFGTNWTAVNKPTKQSNGPNHKTRVSAYEWKESTMTQIIIGQPDAEAAGFSAKSYIAISGRSLGGGRNEIRLSPCADKKSGYRLGNTQGESGNLILRVAGLASAAMDEKDADVRVDGNTLVLTI